MPEGLRQERSRRMYSILPIELQSRFNRWTVSETGVLCESLRTLQFSHHFCYATQAMIGISE